MAACCNNTVTPRMIKAGNVSIGDKIQLEDIPVSSENISSESLSKEQDAKMSDKKEYIPVQSPNLEGFGGISGIEGGVRLQPLEERSGEDSAISGQRSGSARFGPLPYSQMTSYMNNVSMGGSAQSPSIITPQDPMTPDGFEEEIDYTSVQAFNGFLRTQIGRYMRIEQLIGSNTIEDRFGFLVGVGTNFIILQEITTGNIMVIDIFSIRLTYVYYSQPVIPQI